MKRISLFLSKRWFCTAAPRTIVDGSAKRNDESLEELELNENNSSEERIPEKAPTPELVAKEYEIGRGLTEHFPSNITEKNIEYLLEFGTISARIRYLLFLGKKERAQAKDQDEKDRKQSEERKTTQSVWNTIFQRISDAAIGKNMESFSRWPVTTQKPTVVVDCSFLPVMDPYLRTLTLSQIKECWSLNRHSRSPCNLVFTDVPSQAKWFPDSLESFFHSLRLDEQSRVDCPSIAAEFTEQSLLDIFPRDRLVYLSPDARNQARRLDESKIYIIGGIVDKAGFPIPQATQTKAAENGIETMALPLNRYTKWGTGGKALCLQHVLGMLLDVYQLGDWRKAIRYNVPKRKFKKQKKTNPKVAENRAKKMMAVQDIKELILQRLELENKI